MITLRTQLLNSIAEKSIERRILGTVHASVFSRNGAALPVRQAGTQRLIFNALRLSKIVLTQKNEQSRTFCIPFFNRTSNSAKHTLRASCKLPGAYRFPRKIQIIS
jgi:hypothetical protein